MYIDYSNLGDPLPVKECTPMLYILLFLKEICIAEHGKGSYKCLFFFCGQLFILNMLSRVDF